MNEEIEKVKLKPSDVFINKLIQMFGEKIVKKWVYEYQQRLIDFKEFLKGRNTTYEELLKNADMPKTRFKNKKSLTPEQVKELYNEDSMCLSCLKHYPFHSEEINNKFIIEKDMKILDFGAGLGNDLINFEGKGFTNLHFFEVSKTCIEFMQFLKKKYNSKIKILKELEDNYDVIMSYDVIEHIPNYKEVFEDLFKRLKIGGRFFLGYHFTPKGEEGNPSHYEESYPIPKLFEENGFEQITSSAWRKNK